jgi:hypothetical protein
MLQDQTLEGAVLRGQYGVEEWPVLAPITARCVEVDMSQFPPSDPPFSMEELTRLGRAELLAAVANAVQAAPLGLDAVGRTLIHQIRFTLEQQS